MAKIDTISTYYRTLREQSNPAAGSGQVLQQLAGGGPKQTFSDLLVHTGMSRPNLSSVVRTLESLDFVRTQRDDAGDQLIELTDAGSTFAERHG